MSARPRLPPVDEPSDEVAALLAKTTIAGGSPQAVFRTLAHHPELLRRTNALGGLFQRSDVVPPRHREIVILRVAWRTRCAYEYAQHRVLGARAGLTEQEVAALTGGAPVSWSPGERALVDLVDALCAHDTVPGELWERLTTARDTPAVLELLVLVGFYRLLAGYLNAVAVVPDEGLDARWPTGDQKTVYGRQDRT